MTDEPLTDAGSSGDTLALSPNDAHVDPLGRLPRLSSRQVRLDARLARLTPGAGLGPALGWLSDAVGGTLEVGRPEVLWRSSGLRRSGLVAQFSWPRLATRFAFGLETPTAHAIVDRLLGFDRLPAETRLPLSPVEWGILTFVVAETVRRLAEAGPCPFGVWDPTIDRVGPDPFDPAGLGPVVTVRWPVKLGGDTASIRLWVSESLTERWLASRPPPAVKPADRAARADDLSSLWRAEAGRVTLPRGLNTLRPRGVLPLTGSSLIGTPQSPEGVLGLTLDLAGGGRFVLPAEPVPLSGGGRLTVSAPLRHAPTPREASPMSPPPVPANPDPTAPSAGDVPVTLVVELGRVNLTLGRLADLRPGDVVELGRNSREPIELTSNGRLVARGELVLIDTELGVRLTHVFL